MIVFPNAKINLGLNVVARRPDGYHELDMVMAPIGWCDILEVIPSRSGKTTLITTGRHVDCPTEKNLVYKAYMYLRDFLGGELEPVDMFLHKVIPDGAGLGGGSSDASFALIALNSLFELGLDKDTLCGIAANIGADCPFFIHNRPMLCTGTGTDMTPVTINSGNICSIVVAKPCSTSVSTAEAYSGVTPHKPAVSASEIVSRLQPAEWNGKLINSFEQHIFKAKPVIADIKKHLYKSGAVYASMSGSGSAVYGLFDNAKMADSAAASLSGCAVFVDEWPSAGIG